MELKDTVGMYLLSQAHKFVLDYARLMKNDDAKRLAEQIGRFMEKQ